MVGFLCNQCLAMMKRRNKVKDEKLGTNYTPKWRTIPNAVNYRHLTQLVMVNG